MNKNNIIILCVILVIALIIWYIQYNNVELLVEGYAVTKKVDNIYDIKPDFYDYYDYQYYDWIPTMDLVRPRAIWPELMHYNQYMENSID